MFWSIEKIIFLIYIRYILRMKKVIVETKTHLKLEGISCFMKKKVTRFGTGAKVDCPKEFLGKDAYLVIIDNDINK